MHDGRIEFGGAVCQLAMARAGLHGFVDEAVDLIKQGALGSPPSPRW